MLYLKAQALIAAETFDEYEGQKGQFIKTFALNDKRNKNGWRVTWASIKKDIPTFLADGGRPGIEFVKCEKEVCDLDHTEGATFEQSLEVQEPYRVTTIIDYVLDEATHTAYFIHKSLNAEFYQKVKDSEIKYVSPSIWPARDGFEILGKMENGLPMIDVYEWKGLHDAFVNNPAFGDEAKVTATCEGEGCAVRLLSAASLMGGSECVQRCIEEKRKKGITINDQALAICYSECGKSSSGANNSLSGCGCSRSLEMVDSNQPKSAAEKAAEDILKAKDEELKTLRAKVAKLEAEKAASAATDDDNKDDDEEDDEDDADKKSAKSKKAAGAKSAKVEDSKAVSHLKATIASLQAVAAKPLIASMVEAREAAGMSEEDIEAFKASLEGKSFDAIKAMHDAEAVYHQAFKARSEEEGGAGGREHFAFNGGNGDAEGALSGKAYEIVFDEERTA